jgi:hypothetical protein
MNNGNEQMPSPEDRERAVREAFKNSNWASDAFSTKESSDEHKAQQRLEEATVKIFKTCREVKELDIANGGTYDETAMGRLIMAQWIEFLRKESKEGIIHMSSIVLTGTMLSAINEL